MITSKLSDHDREHLSIIMYNHNTEALYNYVNKLLYKKALGLDSCAKPISARDKKDMDNPCFAQGYLKKVLEFSEQTILRESPEVANTQIVQYIKQVCTEIDNYFNKDLK